VTVFQSRIDALQDNHWAAIMDGARQYMGKKRATILKEEIGEKMDVMGEEEEEDNTMLVDPMFE
jgi:hypothetical protein